MDGKRVLFIRSNPVSPDPRVEKEAYTLSKNGYSVTVLAWDRSCQEAIRENKDLFQIFRVRIRAPYGKPSLIFGLIKWNLKELSYLIKNDYDIIHSCDLDTLIPAVLVSKMRGNKIVFDSFDFYSDSITKAPRIIRGLIGRIERTLVRFVDVVIIADESRIYQYNGYLKNFIVINNSPAEFKDIESHNTKDNKKFTIFYAGILNKTRGFEQLFTAISNIDNISIEIAGFGSDEIYIKNLCDRYSQVKFLGILEYKDVIRKTRESDLLFALYDPKVPNNKYASPNKLFEAMMCSKPIIVSDSTSMAYITKEENCGIVVEYGDIISIRNAILLLMNEGPLRESLGRNGRNAYDKKYKWELMERRLLDAYKRWLS